MAIETAWSDRPTHRQQHDWVLAAPFRTQLRDLIADSGLPWQALAVHAGLPLRTARSLLFGRAGRQLPRIPPRLARRILAVPTASLVGLDRQFGDIGLARQSALALHRRGLSVIEIGLLARTDRADIERLLEGSSGWVSVRTTLLLQSACAERGERWAEPRDPWVTDSQPDEVAA